MRLVFLILLCISLALAKSPTGGYAPGNVTCPSSEVNFLREANSLSVDEKNWVKERHKKTQVELKTFLKKTNLKSFDVEQFFKNSLLVNIGLAFSGGGYRAMLNGAGHMAALDKRTRVGNSTGLGGILQASTYVGALSGGGYMLGSLVMQGWPSVQDVVFQDANDLWNLTDTRQLVNQTHLYTLGLSILFDKLDGALEHLNFWDNNKNGIKYDIQKKEAAGFETSVTDIWGRGLAHQLYAKGKDNYMASSTWSDIRNESSFKNHDMPFPLLTSLGRKPGTTVYNLNSSLFEISPFELGSFDSHVNAFTDIKYLGTKVVNGKPQDKCVEGFDNAGFIVGTTSSLFNQFLNTLVCEDCSTLNWILKPILKRFLDTLSNEHEDIASYKPNPFYKSNYTKSTNISESDTLFLMDGGLGGEVLPLSSMLVTHRNLDVLFAFEETPDTQTNWPNGTSLVSTYEKQFTSFGSSVVFPYVPDATSFLEQNLTARPTFFGCDASNLTDLKKDGVIPPLVIYIANRPYEFYSNVSTYKLTFTDEEKKGMIQNGFDIATRLNNTIDHEWAACVGCAVVRREEERRGIKQTSQCQQCFKRYCWDGKVSMNKKFVPPVNFTDNGLTNGSTVFYGKSLSKSLSASFELAKRTVLPNSAPAVQIPLISAITLSILSTVWM
ncbi:uncharacterized protein PRCAT00000985001 [Priceomyces carsonii]|uniref:uncharacterized protein n=1 Tax=Priceomyces carsonii TaxID=28549 RepID=UPI002ED859DC|nr:unnamed protein product [Priceomyces carsonii]